MASILDRYGIKEVADVQFFEIDSSTGEPSKLVLYLDTLKVSTIEQTADNVEAKGGKGNPSLVSWDYNKDINVTLEDALFSAKSMAIMFGGEKAVKGLKGNDTTKYSPYHTFKFKAGEASTYTEDSTQTINGSKFTITGLSFYDENGESSTSTMTGAGYVTAKLTVQDSVTIDISNGSFPGTYYVVGDTYARSDIDGHDDFFQFVIPKAKVTSENTITMEADGDPSVFNLNLKVLRPADGKMMKLIRYTGEKED